MRCGGSKEKNAFFALLPTHLTDGWLWHDDTGTGKWSGRRKNMADLRESLLKLLLRPSARDYWLQAASRPGSTFFKRLHGYFYLRWTELYIGIGLGRHPAARWIKEPAWRLGRWLGFWGKDAGEGFADHYHGKVLTPPLAGRLIQVNRALNVEVPEKVLPYALARQIVLENQGALAALRCPCRATVKNPCKPLDVCIIVGQTFVDFLLEHHPAKTRRVNGKEALAIIKAENKRGHVSHAFFKEEMLGRYYAICNCCTCCCGAMQAYFQGVPMLAASGYVAEPDPNCCTHCGACRHICPFRAIHSEQGKTKVDRTLCMGCGICAMRCPNKCINLAKAGHGPAPLDILEYM